MSPQKTNTHTKTKQNKTKLSKFFLVLKSMFDIFVSSLSIIKKGLRPACSRSFATSQKNVMRFPQKSLPIEISLFKVKFSNTSTFREICSILMRKTPEKHQQRHSGVFNLNFEQISHVALVFPLLNLNKYMPGGSQHFLKHSKEFFVAFLEDLLR